MSDRTLRFFVAGVISLLLIHQIGVLVSAALGATWGLVSALVVAAVSFFSARLAKAGGKGSFWFLIPTLLFTVIPIVMTVWNAFTSEASWLDRLIGLAPFFIGFGLPIVLLFLTYIELRKRTLNG